MIKRVVSFIILLSMILSLSSFIGIAKDYEVLTNITFEKGKDNWYPWSSAGEHMSEVIKDGYSEGKRGLRIIDDDETITTGVVSETVPVEAGEMYTCMADTYLAAGFLNMSIKFYNAEGKTIASNTIRVTKGKWANVLHARTAPENAVAMNVSMLTGNELTCVAIVDNIKIVKGEAKAITPEGKLPDKLPIPESELNPQPVVDGIPDGTVIYSTSFEEALGTEYGYQGSGLYVDSVAQVDSEATDGQKSIRITDYTGEGAPGLITKMIPISAGNNYAFTIDAKWITGTMKIFAKFLDLSRAQVSCPGMTFVSHDWATVNLNATAPLDAKYVQVFIAGYVVTKGDCLVDNLKITKGFIDPVMLPKRDTEFTAPTQVPVVDATLVAPVNNKLQYNSYSDKGDTISDFSYAGFTAGKYNLPDTSKLPVVATLSPTGTGDDTKLIQDAIDKAAAESPDNSMKVIKLKAGKYYISSKALFLKSGIILSGEGQGPTGTILYSFDPVQHIVLYMNGNPPTEVGDKVNITDEYVPTGKRTFTVEDASSFKVGDLINVTFPATDEWARHIEMSGLINVNGGDSSWGGEKQNMVTERTITAINGNEITIDVAIFVPLPKNLGQSYIVKVDDSGKIENSGVENLRFESTYNGMPEDEKHATTAICTTNSKNVFVRDVTAKHFYNSLVSSKDKAKQVTAVNCSSIEPVSSIAGSRRYTFAVSTSAQQILYTGCYSHAGRHDYETSFEATGPIVFSDSVADESYGGIETHGTWTTGVLYDNVYSIANGTQASIGIKNHGYFGTTESQGWTGAGCVVWNSLAPALIVHRPPEPYQNFLVGSWGIYNDEKGLVSKEENRTRYIGSYTTTTIKAPLTEEHIAAHFATKEGSPFIGDSYAENEFTPVNPRSLFKAQLSERFTGVISNARPNAPTIVNPKYDRFFDKNNVTIDGFCQLGASKVTVFIDDEPYNATINSENVFSFSKELKEGVHKIYATQVIDGVESTKSPDRFIIVKKFDDVYPSYLQSVYDISKTSLLVNDPRPTYDVYQNEVLNNKIKVLVNGALLKSDVEPFETNGRVLVPMRAIFEALSAEVSWDGDTSTATATKGETVVKITENKTTTYVNNAPYELDVPATILNGRFVVPVRFISESFGCKVDWIDATKTVVITSK